MGPGPCHLTLDRDRRHLLVTNCAGGSVAVLPVAADGRLGAPTEVVQQPGPRPQPQGVTLSPDNRFAFVCDPALDRILAYRFDAAKGKLTPASPAAVPVKPGSGPGRLAFRSDGRFAYAVGTRSSTVIAYAYDGKTGALREVQTISTLPPWFDGKNAAAEIAVHPKADYLFVSNRGHNTVVLFTVDPGKGTLTYVEDQDAGGKTPRHFGLDPSAEHLAIANQDSDNVLVCRIDGGTGRLKPSGVFTTVPAPACVKFLPPRQP
jgi:6-phosphogluconolactonase